jgi:predicted amidophosphoribosyltransferase
MILICAQCGLPRSDTGWRICGDCLDKNVAYQKSCEKLARTLHHEFMCRPPGSPLGREYRRTSEMRGRKARNVNVLQYLPQDDD